MIDHVYVLLVINDFGEPTVSVYQHRANAIYDTVHAASNLGMPLDGLVCSGEEHTEGPDMWTKAQYGPASVTLYREVPK